MAEYSCCVSRKGIIMKQGWQGCIVAMCAVLCISFGNWQCTGDDDAGDLARQLDERLTDALDFPDAELLDGPAPQGDAGTDAPQITDIAAPPSLTLRDTFTLDISTQFAEADLIDGIILRVGEAERYILVPVVAPATQIQVQGVLGDDVLLAENTFTISVALKTVDDITGLYQEWSLTIDNNAVSTQAIRSGCNNIFQYCSEYPAFFQNGVDDPSKCQSVTSCVAQFYADDPGCVDVFNAGVACLSTLNSADTCAACEDAMMQISGSGCGEPVSCYP